MNNGTVMLGGQEVSKEILKKRIRYDKYLREAAMTNIQNLTVLKDDDCKELGLLT